MLLYNKLVVLALVSRVVSDPFTVEQRLVSKTNIIQKFSAGLMTACYAKCFKTDRCITVAWLLNPFENQNDMCYLLMGTGRKMTKMNRVETLYSIVLYESVEVKEDALAPAFEGIPCKESLNETKTCDIRSCRKQKISLSISKETVMKKNNLIGTLSTLSKEYSISFDVKPTAYGGSFTSVLHVTLGGDEEVYGDRTPAVFFFPSSPSATRNKLLITSAISGKITSPFTTKEFPTNEWIAVKIGQHKVESDYFYTIHINGVQVYKVKNTDVRDVNNLKVYVGNPWYAAQQGFLRNLKIVNI